MRTDGYVPIADYGLIGDGRTAALVSTDGAIDWLCLPALDSPSVFGAILDAGRGGTFVVRPSIPFTTTRRYLPGTNVLETTFQTDRGVVRVVDAMTLPSDGLEPGRELIRKVSGMSGSVPMTWLVAPRFEYGRRAPTWTWRNGSPVALDGGLALAIRSWDAGRPTIAGGAAAADMIVREGDESVLCLAAAQHEPLVLPSRADVSRRLDATIAFWRAWSAARGCEGRWADMVLRSALVLKLLIFAPSGASCAAPTTSLPERLGGVRNWDYRFCWIRDSNFTIDALLALGCYDEARALFWWFMQATARTEPELHVLYRLDGGLGGAERELALEGYRRSRPVRVGNAAVGQVQLDIYGDLLQTAWLFSRGQHSLDPDTGAVLARVADYVCRIWRQPDAGIWEVRNGPFQFTHSKVMCWVALDRACRLAESSELPDRHAARWRREADAVRNYVERNCWSEARGSYTRIAGGTSVDASLLMLPLVGFPDPGGSRLRRTVDAISADLRHGEFVYRYHADDGLPGSEGGFLNCSFWMVSALARTGRLDEAGALMTSLIGRANDLGLYAEEIDPATGTFLGNFPQGLVHLALIDAALALDEAERQGQAGAQRPERSSAGAVRT